MTELLIKNILTETLFGSRICESMDDLALVNYMYENLMLEKLLYGQPITVPELRSLLRQKILNFKFIKLDGEIRPAKGTTMMKYIPQRAHPKGGHPSSPKVATFFDLKKQDWRSVSQRSKEIVLDKDEETGKPVVMVKDKGDEDVAVNPQSTDDTAIDTTVQPEETIDNVEEIPTEETPETGEISAEVPQKPSEVPEEMPEIPGETPEEEVEVTSVKPIESTAVTKPFYFINPKTGASQAIEMTPKDAVKQLRKMGADWELSDAKDFEKKEQKVKSKFNPKEDVIEPGQKRNYLNPAGRNEVITIVAEDPEGGVYAKKNNGPTFKIPAGQLRNLGGQVEKTPETPTYKPRPIFGGDTDLDLIDANEV